MATRSPTLLLLRDEFIGYAKSKVMLVLWIVMPILSIVIYLTLPDGIGAGVFFAKSLSASMFISFLMSSIGGTVSSIMVAVDLVGERNRKVYDLFVIRPVPRDAIIWSKFIAVITTMVIACIAAFICGLAVDLVRGRELPSQDEIARAIAQLFSVLVVNTAGAVFIGVLARTVLVAVVLVQFVSSNLSFFPLLPTYFGVGEDQFWLIMFVSTALSIVVVYLAALVFRRTEL